MGSCDDDTKKIKKYPADHVSFGKSRHFCVFSGDTDQHGWHISCANAAVLMLGDLCQVTQVTILSCITSYIIFF